MESSEKTSPGSGSIEPKKSIRLAQKRKLREEAGPPGPNEDDYYFKPYEFTKSGSPNRAKTASESNSPTSTPGPASKKLKSKQDGADSPTPSSPFPKLSSPSPKLSKMQSTSSATPTRLNKGPPSEDSNSSHSGQSTPKKKVVVIKGNGTGMTVADEEALEEEKWLDALEAGKLEELDEELRQMKNPKALTARQRAMMEKKDKDVFGFVIDEDSGLMELFKKGKEKVIVTQEMIKLKAEKMEKRRQLAQEKKEIDRKKTMDRLLKKQNPKILKATNKGKMVKKLCPSDQKITFISKVEGNVIAFPVGHPLPFQDKLSPSIPVTQQCRAGACSNPKKYTCSKTGVPLCSLQCYRTNLASYQ